MPDRQLAAPFGRIAVVDVGSNSLRLVVFERLGATLLPLLNEKVMCALGRGISTTGRLNPDGVELAFANLQRFVALARALDVDHLAIIATAAVREASDGEAFAAEAERRCGVRVRIVAGSEEARLSAAGVLAGIRAADGVVGDLGGGSVELVRVKAPGKAPIGAGVSLPLGPLRLAELGDNSRATSETIERAIADAPVLREAAGKALYLVGGAWRAIARLHMEQTHYPLHIIHEYTLARRPAEGFLDIIASQSRRSLERIASINRRRLELVPLAALILRRLIAVGRPDRIVFSAFGLREGYAYGLLPAAPGTDSLIAACQGIAASASRSRGDGDRLQRWTAAIFPALDEPARRLHRAACWLSDFAWTEHPDYRAEHAFTRSLRMPVGQLGHDERVFIGAALHARYGGASDDPVRVATRPLIEDAAAAEARVLGLALRLAYTLCGGALELLDEVRLSREPRGLVLELPRDGSLFTGEAVQRRLDALGRALNLEAHTVRRRTPSPALASLEDIRSD
ncbi:MAG TPA: Ppx/GppA family phosphatase [Stellaceae bacterium]|nr:Ppx/GppA family phosphatase [Stellaceae bacterium]